MSGDSVRGFFSGDSVRGDFVRLPIYVHVYDDGFNVSDVTDNEFLFQVFITTQTGNKFNFIARASLK